MSRFLPNRWASLGLRLLFLAGGAVAGVLAARCHVAAVAREEAFPDAPIGDITLIRPTCGEMLAAVDARHAYPLLVDWEKLDADRFGKTSRIERAVFLKNVSLEQLTGACNWRGYAPKVFVDQGAVHIGHPRAIEPEKVRDYEVGDILAAVSVWNRNYDRLDIMRPMPRTAAEALQWVLEIDTDTRCAVFQGRVLALGGDSHQRDLAMELEDRRELIARRTASPVRLPHLRAESDPIDRPVAAQDLGTVTLREAVNRLQSAAGVNVIVDWDSLAGIDSTAPKPLRIPAGRAGDVLVEWFSLDRTSAIALVGADGAILVAPPDRFQFETLDVTRCHPLANLPQNQAILAQIRTLAKVRLLPGWLIVRAGTVRQLQVEKLLDRQVRP
jgi:hypothetical protein